MKFKLTQPMFAPEGSTGGGYQLTPEQFDSLSLDDSDPEVVLNENEDEFEENDEQNSEFSTSEGDDGENNIPTEIEIPGIGKVSIDEINQWKSGHLMQSDYTRKTQEIAEQRRQLEQQFAPYQKLDELFSTNPALEQQFIQMLQGNLGNEQANEMKADFDISRHPMFQQMQNQIQQQEQFMEQFRQQQIQEEIRSEWNGLFSKFPDAKGREQEIAQFADANNLKLEQAYMIMNFNNVKQQTQSEMVRNNMKKKPANTIRPVNNSGKETPKVLPDGNYNSLVDYLMGQNLNLTE